MAIIKPFKGLRPPDSLATKVAARPYDVLNSEEARVEAHGNPYSFLHVTKPEIDLPEGISLYDDQVYAKAKDNFNLFLTKKYLVPDAGNYLYVYRQIMGSHAQVGLMACSSVQDYLDDVIKKHEFTRPVKENDRIRHMREVGAHVGPVFLAYPEVYAIDEIIDQVIAHQDPETDIETPDLVRHTIWVVRDRSQINDLLRLFRTKVPYTYIADGHHRAASSAKVGVALKEANPDHTGDEEYNYFLSVLFPADQLAIQDYNRLVRDLNGLSHE